MSNVFSAAEYEEIHKYLKFFTKLLLKEDQDESRSLQFTFKQGPYYFGRFGKPYIESIPFIPVNMSGVPFIPANMPGIPILSNTTIDNKYLSNFKPTRLYKNFTERYEDDYENPYQPNKVYNMPNITVNIVVDPSDYTNNMLLGYIPGIEQHIDDIQFIRQFSMHSGIHYGFIAEQKYHEMLPEIKEEYDNETDDYFNDIIKLDDGHIQSSYNYVNMTLYFLSLHGKFAGFLFINFDNFYDISMFSEDYNIDY